jgi:hypothetical protein
MFLSRILSGAVALSMLANDGPGVAADQSVTPMAATDCKTLAVKISQAVGIPLRTRVGKPDLSGIDGNACLMSGRATGLKASFADVENQLNAIFAGWTPLSEFAADAGGGTQQGFSKASQRLVYQLTNYPPRGTCENVVVAACKVSRQRWIWTLKVIAFVQ